MSRTNAKKGKQAAPTTEEILELHEGQDLFRSNLFRLQLNELLSEVKVVQSKTTTTQNELRELKEVLEAIPDREIKAADLRDLQVPLHGSPSDPRLHFSFRAPRNLQVVGSFLLNTVCRPDTNVDLAVEIPKKCLVTSDATNGRYEDKRAIYLYLLAQHLNSLDLYRDRIYFEAFRGDRHKPLLCIKQSSQRKKKTRFVIRIHTVVPEKLFRPGRLVPTWHNLQEDDEEQDSDAGRPSPFRNNAIVEDLMMVPHLAQLHTTITDCPAMIDAIVMFKVWLRQRDSLSEQSFNGFLMSMLMVYLLQSRQLNNQMSSYQLFRVTMAYLAAGTLLDQPISLEESADTESLSTFKECFDIVFLDASGRLNLASRVSRSGMQELQYEAQLAMKFLKADATTGFQALFLSHVPFSVKFDQFFAVQPPKSLLVRPASHPLDDRNWDDRVILQMHKLFEDALHNRMPLICLRFPALPTWQLNDAAPTHQLIWAGIRLDPEHAFDTLERGPSADDEEASQSFKNIWKDKSDLWQMNDGSLVQAVEWEVESEKEHLLPSLQISYLLEKHFNVDSKSLCAFAGQLDPILFAMHPKAKSFPTPLRASLYLLSVYETLEEMVYGLSDLPLRIADIHRGHSALSFTALHTPIPHPLLVPRERTSKKQQYLRYAEPVPVILELEESSQWPNDIQAIGALKSAFYVLLARELKKHHALECLVTKQYIDVFIEGLVFRIRIYVPKEIDATEQFISIQHAKDLVRENVHKPAHWAAMRGLQSTYSVFGTTVRLAKFWAHTQLLSAYLNEPTIELLVASLFTSPAPFSAPRSHLIGFFRFLQLLSSFPWAVSPLIVDVNDDLTVEQHTQIQNEFNRLRKQEGSENHSAMFIATPRDLQSVHWTRQNPSPMILQRIVTLASQCMERLQNKMDHPFTQQLNTWKDWQTLFCTPLSDFDVVIRLHPEIVPSGTQHGFYDKILDQFGVQMRTDKQGAPSSELLHRVSKFRNFEESLGASQLLVGVHPVHRLVEELEQHFGDVAMFFYGEAGVNIIGVLWKPAAFMPQTIKPHTLQYSLPLPDQCQPSKTPFVLRNVFDMISDIRTMGSGLISDVHLVQGSHKVNQ